MNKPKPWSTCWPTSTASVRSASGWLRSASSLSVLLAAICSDAPAQCASGTSAPIEIPCSVALDGEGDTVYVMVRTRRPNGTSQNHVSGSGCSPVGQSGISYNLCCLADGDGTFRFNLARSGSVYGAYITEVVATAYSSNPIEMQGQVLWSKVTYFVGGSSGLSCPDFTLGEWEGACGQEGEDAFTYDPGSLVPGTLGFILQAEDPFTGSTWEFSTDDIVSGSVQFPAMPDGQWVVNAYALVDDGSDGDSFMYIGTMCGGSYPGVDTGDLPPGTGDPDEPLTGGDAEVWMDGMADRITNAIGESTGQIIDAINDQSSTLDQIASNTAAGNGIMQQISDFFFDLMNGPSDADGFVEEVMSDHIIGDLQTGTTAFESVPLLPTLPTGGSVMDWTLPVDVLGQEVVMDLSLFGNALATIPTGWLSLFRAMQLWFAWCVFVRSLWNILGGGQ